MITFVVPSEWKYVQWPTIFHEMPRIGEQVCSRCGTYTATVANIIHKDLKIVYILLK
jgi:hypothetical protein